MRGSYKQNFPNNDKRWGSRRGKSPQWQIENFPGGGIFLPGGENLRRDDFDYLNLLQS